MMEAYLLEMRDKDKELLPNLKTINRIGVEAGRKNLMVKGDFDIGERTK